jgi:nucleotidyltransferase/DNA polymerase involved in DNA repair
MAAVLSGRLRRRRLRGRLVSVEVLYPDIGEETRSVQLPDYADTAQTLMAAGMDLLRRTEVSTRGVRRLGLSLGSFSGEAAEQLDLFG